MTPRLAAWSVGLFMAALCQARGVSAVPTLAEALLEDMLPPSSSKCIGGGATSITFNFTSSQSISKWDETAYFLEDGVFLAEMSHADAERNRSWTLRVGKAGNMYSFVGPFGEIVPPQYHPNGPFVDEVWQSVMVHAAKNNKPPLNKPNFIHQAGAYWKDCDDTDGSPAYCDPADPTMVADSTEGDYMEKPYFSPSVASHCEGRQCSFASWGTQAHVPTPFKSAALYMNKYRDCGEGVMEYTQLVHNFGEDIFDYHNTPWGGVRTSVFQDMQIAQPNDAAALHKDRDDSFQLWGQAGAHIPNIKHTGGYATFVENLVCSTCATFSLPCADANGNVVDCSSSASVGQLQVVIQTCSEDAAKTTQFGTLTLRCRMASTVTVKTGCSGCNLFFTNTATGAVIAVKGVHHWAWSGRDMYLFPTDSTLSQVQAAFPNPSTVTVTRADYGKPAEENLALSYVFGVNAERFLSDNNGLKYINLNAGPRMRYGDASNIRRDYTVWTINPYVNIEQGDTFAVRHYLITDKYVGSDARAASWVPEVYMVQREAGQMPGRSVDLYSDGKSAFGATVNGSACGFTAATIVCTGRTTPQAVTQPPLYAIECGNQKYVGTDLYHFSPVRASEAEAIRSYVCRDQPADVRPSITLLGWFPDGACASLHNASYQESYCDARAPATTPAPVDEVKMKVALPYTVSEFTPTVQNKFKAGVAAVALVDPGNVVINSIIAAASSSAERRLLSQGVIVDFSIITLGTAGVDKAGPIKGALSDVTAINEALVDQGVAAISSVVEAPLVVSSGASSQAASNATMTLEPTRDFSLFPQCSEKRTWPSVRHLLKSGKGFTGGLGELMTREHQVYFCFKGHACLADVGASALDHMCYLYSELEDAFQAWGFNSELQLL